MSGGDAPLPEPDERVWRPFWERFQAAVPAHGGTEPFSVFAFGDGRAVADELADLVARGVKRATTASAEGMRLQGVPTPPPGALSVVLRGDGTPVCVIETVETFVTTLDGVDARFAADEGEGDGSLASWRREHERVFRREAAEVGYAFGPAMEVECERFRLVWPAPEPTAS